MRNHKHKLLPCNPPSQPVGSEWLEVDEKEIQEGVPEADGVLAATRRRMSFMPLELFDNTEYDLHTLEEWVELGAGDGVSWVWVWVCVCGCACVCVCVVCVCVCMCVCVCVCCVCMCVCVCVCVCIQVLTHVCILL